MKNSTELAILNNIDVPTLIISKNGTIEFCNNAACLNLNRTAEELIENHFEKFMIPEVSERRKAILKECLESGRKIVFEDVRDSRNLLHSVTPLSSERAIITLADVTNWNIKEQQNIRLEKLVETRTSELKKTRDFLQSVIDAIPYPLAVKDSEHKWVLINKIIGDMFQLPVEEMIGKTDYDFIRKEEADVFRAVEENVFATGEPNVNEEKLTEIDGRERWQVAEKALFHDPDGNKYLIAIARDITEKKLAEIELEKHREKLEELVAERTAELLRTQDQLIQSQKMDAIGKLAGGIAHEFNNILAIVIATTSLVLDSLGESDPNFKHMDRIKKVAARAKDMTMNLLTFARKEKLDVRSTSADAIVSELLDLLKRTVSNNINICSETAKSSATMSLDINQAIQSLLNVSINACDSMSENGVITILAEDVSLNDKDCAAIPNSSPGDYCRISVIDTGKGMPADVINRIFEPFFTTKERGKGTGLGMPITLGIVQRHNGFMSINSAPGKGTRVDIYFPATNDSSPAAPAASREDSPPKVAGTILVVDDDKDFLEITAEILAINGLNPIPASGAARALELYRKRRHEIDLVILDMMMPEVDGVETFRLLRAINPDVKVIVCSGYSIDRSASRVINDGALGFLQKPFENAALISMIADVLSTRQLM
ncbi:MAG TPA: PAS domain-containing protein [bacterium]|nr:PAS domain-containing protein [bacterium]